MDWENSAQQWGSMLLDRWSAKEYAPTPSYTTPYRVSPTGQPYIEGQPGVIQPAGFRLSMPVILAGVGIVAVVLLMRKG